MAGDLFCIQVKIVGFESLVVHKNIQDTDGEVSRLQNAFCRFDTDPEFQMKESKIVIKGNLCSSKPTLSRVDNELLVSKMFKTSKLKKMLKLKKKYKQ